MNTARHGVTVEHRRANGRENLSDAIPHSVEAEQATLGSLILDPACWSRKGSLTADDFYRPDHRYICEAIGELIARGTPPDVITLSQHLQDLRRLDDAGGLAYIAQLARDTPTAANFDSYAAVVCEKSAQRRYLELCKRIPEAIAQGATSKQLTASLRATLDHLERVKETHHGYELLPASELMHAAGETEWLVEDLFELGHIGFVGPPESGKSVVALNVAACIASGQPFHGRRVTPGLVVYLVGEGQRGMRFRLQALEARYRLGVSSAPLVFAKAPASFLDSAELARVKAAIDAAERRFERRLALLVVDTVARFIAPGNEDKAQDLGTYLLSVERLRGDAAAISIHHPGHGDATRARGSSSWRAGLDSEFTFASASNVVTLTCQKMKDGARPSPLSFRVEPAPTLSARADGSPIMSIVLISATDGEAVQTQSRPTGKNQKLLLAELERLASVSDGVTIWTEGVLREIARTIGMHKNSARDAVLGLRQLGYLTATVGGSRLSHATPCEGPKDRNRTESTVSSPAKGPKTGNEAPVSLETVPSVLSAVPSVEVAAP